MALAVQPYLFLIRLDRPIGTWLLLLPGWWAILLAGGGVAPMALFAIGALVMRSAGCIVNDLWDRDLDRRVERTRQRPLASGAVQPWQAVLFLFVLLIAGLVILLQFNRLTVLIGCASIAFIALYPLMKRITWWPQAFLGLTFNFGALMGTAAVTGDLGWQAWVLYASGFFWTLGYDTIYALQDRTDDIAAGIKSSARLLVDKFGKRVWCCLLAFYCVHYLLLCIALAGIIPFSPLWGVAALPFLHLAWQVKTLDMDDQMNALVRFRSNRDYGLLICAAIIILS